MAPNRMLNVSLIDWIVSGLDWLARLLLIHEIVKKLYHHLDPEARWTIRLLIGGTIAMIPTISTGIGLLLLGILPIGLNGNPVVMLGGASTLPLVCLPTFYPLWHWLGRHIDFKSPPEYVAWAVG